MASHRQKKLDTEESVVVEVSNSVQKNDSQSNSSANLVKQSEQQAPDQSSEPAANVDEGLSKLHSKRAAEFKTIGLLRVLHTLARKG
ncbi:hypothetical protein LSTR_LSTR001570 [Laodelphax striatellus]|uniref:Uncharacterized protein n=1 Tax=Laodelphax striatellus TaxID=195883 RepID=A0A482XC91_LAOST|nr:hypothetical protein LSTR_LSTR001570 [Laodelphax striatellus]